MARNFTQPDTQQVHDAIAEATAPSGPVEVEVVPKKKKRKEYTEEEAREIKSKGTATGHKGVRMDRINLAFTPENYEYIQIMGRVSGEGMTNFVNKILEQHRRDNSELYEKARAFREALDKYQF